MKRKDDFIHINQRKHSIGRLCQHCRKPAVTTAVRVYGQRKLRMPVWYCPDHTQSIIRGN